MHPVLQLLDAAEETWRDAARSEFPLFAATPVKKAAPDPKHKRHWQFFTDGSTTHMDVFKPDVVESVFETVVKDLYRNAYGVPISDDHTLVRRLIHDTFAYLYFHEILHPAVTPDSKLDEKLFDKALYDGIKKASSSINEADILHKVGNVRNAGWDIAIDDFFFFLSNYDNNLERRLKRVIENKQGLDLPAIHTLPDGVVPIFDVIEIYFSSQQNGKSGKSGFQSLFYPITRLMYGLLFVRDASMRKGLGDFFKAALAPQIKEDELRVAVTDALKGVVRELDGQQLSLGRIDKSEYETAVDHLYNKYGDPAADADHRRVVEVFTRACLDKRLRYTAVKGFIQPLARYISLQREEKRHGTHISDEGSDGSGQQDGQSSPNQGGGNMQQALLNLADILNQQDANALLSSVANNPSGSLGGKGIREQKLSLIATDEYYKRNAKEINIRSPRQEMVRLDLGKRQRWVKISAHYLQTQDLPHLPLEGILAFQQETGITQLFQLNEHEWQYDVYEREETQEFDYTAENRGLELPDNLVFHLDSSGSMGSPTYVNTNCSYDMLMHVVYGILKTMHKAAVTMKEDVNVIAANFSNGTIVADKPAELKHLYDTPFNDVKKTLLGFQNGGTVYDVNAFTNIKRQLVPGKTVHVYVTDGGLEESCAPQVYNAIEKLVQDPDTTFLYFEMGSGSAFGSRIKQLSGQRPNVKHHPITNLAAVQSQTLEVVLQYEDHRRCELT